MLNPHAANAHMGSLWGNTYIQNFSPNFFVLPAGHEKSHMNSKRKIPNPMSQPRQSSNCIKALQHLRRSFEGQLVLSVQHLKDSKPRF